MNREGSLSAQVQALGGPGCSTTAHLAEMRAQHGGRPTNQDASAGQMGVTGWAQPLLLHSRVDPLKSVPAADQLGGHPHRMARTGKTRYGKICGDCWWIRFA